MQANHRGSAGPLLPLACDMTRTPSASVKGRSSGCSGSAPPPPPKLTTPSSPTCRERGHQRSSRALPMNTSCQIVPGSWGQPKESTEGAPGGRARVTKRGVALPRSRLPIPQCTPRRRPTSRRAMARQMSVSASSAKAPQPVSAMERESSTATTTWAPGGAQQTRRKNMPSKGQCRRSSSCCSHRSLPATPCAPPRTWYLRLSGRVRRIQILSLRKWLAM